MSIRLTALAVAVALASPFAASARAATVIVTTNTTISDGTHRADDVEAATPITLTLAPGGQAQSLAAVMSATVVLAPNDAQGSGGVTGEVDIGGFSHYDQQGGAVTGNVYLGLTYPFEGPTTGRVRGGACLGLVVDQASSADVSGGLIANNGVTATYNSTVDVSGGTIGGPLFADLGATITLEGVSRDLNGNPGVYTGRLSTGPGGRLPDTLDTAGPGTIEVRGYNLVYDGTTLSGNLDDGGLIRSPVTPGTNLFVNGTAVVTPEPAALSAMVAAVGLASRRRRR